MRTPLIFLGLALGAGIAIGVIIQNDSETPGLKTTTATQNTATMAADRDAAINFDIDRSAADIKKLNRLLEDEIGARQALEQKFEELSDQVAAFGGNLQIFNSTSLPEQVENDGGSHVSDVDNGWFNEQALIDNGMSSGQASELKIYFEQLEMDRLYLRDRSIRESWSREKYREAMQALASKEDELTSQLSESAYDSYLYASGQSNRVAVTSVLASAQAGAAGIVSGDYIMRYDNQRIYNWLDLREATASGNISDMVELEVERDGKTIQFYLVRGPLGIRMNSVSVAP